MKEELKTIEIPTFIDKFGNETRINLEPIIKKHRELALGNEHRQDIDEKFFSFEVDKSLLDSYKEENWEHFKWFLLRGNVYLRYQKYGDYLNGVAVSREEAVDMDKDSFIDFVHSLFKGRCDYTGTRIEDKAFKPILYSGLIDYKKANGRLKEAAANISGNCFDGKFSPYLLRRGVPFWFFSKIGNGIKHMSKDDILFAKDNTSDGDFRYILRISIKKHLSGEDLDFNYDMLLSDALLGTEFEGVFRSKKDIDDYAKYLRTSDMTGIPIRIIKALAAHRMTKRRFEQTIEDCKKRGLSAKNTAFVLAANSYSKDNIERGLMHYSLAEYFYAAYYCKDIAKEVKSSIRRMYETDVDLLEATLDKVDIESKKKEISKEIEELNKKLENLN